MPDDHTPSAAEIEAADAVAREWWNRQNGEDPEAYERGPIDPSFVELRYAIAATIATLTARAETAEAEAGRYYKDGVRQALALGQMEAALRDIAENCDHKGARLVATAALAPPKEPS